MLRTPAPLKGALGVSGSRCRRISLAIFISAYRSRTDGTRIFRGAKASEQRPESVSTYECLSWQTTSNVTKKEDTKMKEVNNTKAPRQFNCRNAFLAALHAAVLIVSVVMHPPIELRADRALP